MSLEKNQHKGDAGYIAEELLQGSSELDSKCLVIQKTVADGDFSLEKALHLYEVSAEEYAAFLMRNFMGEFEVTVAALTSIVEGNVSQRKMLTTIELVNKTYTIFVSHLDKDSGVVIRHFEELTKKIKAGKVG